LRKKPQQARQLIYDQFRDTGEWPTLAQFRLDVEGYFGADADADQLLRRIPARLLHPPGDPNSYPAPSIRLVLTAEGISECFRSGGDIRYLTASIGWLGQLAAQSGLSEGSHQCGVHFAECKMAEAVPLPLPLDPNACKRLVKILQSEGWIQVNCDAVSGRDELCASWDVQAFQHVKQFSDYRKTKRRIQRARNRRAGASKNQVWRFLKSDKWYMVGLSVIIAAGTVMLVIGAFH
jgi:hypothetical protein